MEDKRRFRRVAFREPVQFRTKAHSEPEGCVACDLSEVGIRLSSPNFIPIKEEIALTFRVDDGNQIDFNGRVVWVQRVPHSEYYQLGLEFAPPQADNQSQKKTSGIYSIALKVMGGLVGE